MKPPLAMIHSPNFWKAGSVENSRAMDILLVSLANWAEGLLKRGGDKKCLLQLLPHNLCN